MTLLSPSARAARLAPLLGVAVLGLVTLIGFAAPFLPATITDTIGPFLDTVRATPWAPLAAIATYVLFASIGVPQIVLITTLVAAFGPWAGFLYAWTGKVIACSIGFWVGRRFGARIVERHASPRVTALMAYFAKHGFAASALVRLVPTVPSVLVNIAAGATPMRFTHFIAGTAIGSVPKMALLAFGGAAAMAAMQEHSWWAWGALALVIALWVLLAFIGKRLLNRAGANPPSQAPGSQAL